MAEQNKQYAIPESGKETEVDPRIIADIDQILAEAYAGYVEVDPRLADAVQTSSKVGALHEYAIEHPELVDV